MSAGANQPQTSDQIRLVKVNQTLLYIPESMIVRSVRPDDPLNDKNLPAGTVIDARNGVQLSFNNRDFRNPNGDPNRPRPWEPGFTEVHLVDLDSNVSIVSEEEFRREHVRDGQPLKTHFNCNKAYFGRAGFAYCDAWRHALNGVSIKYRWSGQIVDPETWPQMDRRVQKIVEWLATPPERRPAKITD